MSWLLIEPGWQVRTSDGDEAGVVHEVIGDTGADIFDGLAVRKGALSAPRYVPAEQVRAIEDAVVHLALDRGGFEALLLYEEPAKSERLLPETASLTERIAGAVRRLLGRR